MTVVRWGVVGIGAIVQSTIAPILVSEPTTELVAAVSRSSARAHEFGETFGVPTAYTSYDEMLGDPNVDAVYVATPNALHAEQVRAAARAGKHVLCDKPLAIDVPSAIEAVRACEETGVALGLMFHNRFLPWVHEVRRLLHDRAIGRVQLARLQVSSGPRQYDNWRADPAMAGLGTVHNVGVHALDVLRVLLGSEPVEVSATFEPPPGEGVEMLAVVVMRFANSALVHCEFDERLPHPVNDITVFGTTGRIVGTGLTRARTGGDLTVTTDEDETTTHFPAPDAHRLAVLAFNEAVSTGSRPTPSGIDGLRSVELCAAIGQSASEGRTVAVHYRDVR